VAGVLATATVRTITAFPPCRAATAVRMAVSTVSAATAAGGVLASTVAAASTTGTLSTTTTRTLPGRPVRATCLVFVACRTRRVVLAKQAQCAATSREASGVDEKNLCHCLP